MEGGDIVDNSSRQYQILNGGVESDTALTDRTIAVNYSSNLFCFKKKAEQLEYARSDRGCKSYLKTEHTWNNILGVEEVKNAEVRVPSQSRRSYR